MFELKRRKLIFGNSEFYEDIFRFYNGELLISRNNKSSNWFYMSDLQIFTFVASFVPQPKNFSYHNQSRICGEGVGLGLLTRSDPGHTNLLELHTYYCLNKNDCKKFHSNRMASCCKNRKMGVFGLFWVSFSLVSRIPVIRI